MGKRKRQNSDDEDDDGSSTKRAKHQPISIIKVYVDGSFWRKGDGGRPKKGQCKCTRRAGYGVYIPERKKKRKRCYSGRAPLKIKNSDQAEFHAITFAIKSFRTEDTKLFIFTDCLHAVKISEELDDWLQEDKKREEHIEKMFEAMRSCNHLPQLFHVRGHSGIEGNEMADGLAKQGMRKGCGGKCV